MKTKVLIALVAMVLAVACDKEDLQKREHERAIENVVAQCQNFDCTTFAQELPGVWKLDTDVNYDENWAKITDWCLVLGEYNNECVGWRGGTFKFTADGKGSRSPWYYYPGEDETPWVFDWHYDAENNKLVFSSGWEPTVSGFNGEYLVFDYYDTTNKKNVREIYKRQAE